MKALKVSKRIYKSGRERETKETTYYDAPLIWNDNILQTQIECSLLHPLFASNAKDTVFAWRCSKEREERSDDHMASLKVGHNTYSICCDH